MMKIAVGIATAGRREIFSETLKFFREIDLVADEFIICPAASDDVDRELLADLFPHAVIVEGVRGLPAQRNAILQATSSDVMIFFDDDYLPKADFVEQARKLFTRNPDVVVATGKVLADGILTEGLNHDAGRVILQKENAQSDEITTTYNAYGCNMLIRMAPVREHGLKFDENLPLYGWLEDLDFSRQLAPFGKIVKSNALLGVHLGTKKSGRSPGKRLGYSQISNPLYLASKGTMSRGRAYNQMGRNIIANTVRVLKPEPWTDRKGRLHGNLIAISEAVRGRIHPTRVLDFS